MTEITFIQGDITERHVDAMVTAANAELRGGGGVDGAVHRAAGPKLLKACREIGRCSTGSAVITAAFDLTSQGVRHVVHAVGPIWRGGNQNESNLLASVYATSMRLADDADDESIAFPSISTGVYGFPVERAAPIAIQAVRGFLNGSAKSIKLVEFVLFDSETLTIFENAAR